MSDTTPPRFLIAWANLRMFDTPNGLASMPSATYHQMDVALECDCGRRGMAYALDPEEQAPEGFLTRNCPVCRPSRRREQRQGGEQPDSVNRTIRRVPDARPSSAEGNAHARS